MVCTNRSAIISYYIKEDGMKEWRYKNGSWRGSGTEEHNVHEYVDVNEDGFGWTLARIWQHRRDGYRVYTKKEDSMGWCLRTTLSDIDAAKVAAMLFC